MQWKSGPSAGRVPPGQVLTEKWPVLSYGSTPRFDPRTWTFEVAGLVERPLRFSHEEFLALPQTEVTSDIHCVTRWSRLDNRWEGVSFRHIFDLCRPLPEGRYATISCEGGYTTNVALSDLLTDDVLFAHRHDGKDLTPDHGWPLRLVVPRLYLWKSAKWVRRVEFRHAEEPGFWEMYGYHMRGDPWKEERYS